jgi:predicted HicB family RNase H-like nuclease
MTYKGYTAAVELDEEDRILFGRVMGLRDVITFEAETVPQAIEEFHNSVDTYLELCASRGEEPEKPYSGNFLARIGPELHRELARYAAQRDASINAVITDAIAELIQRAADLPPRRAEVPPGKPTSALESRDPKTGRALAKRKKAKGA